MRMLRNVPLKRKLTIVTMVTSGVVLLLACVVIAAGEVAKARNAMLTEVMTLAQMIGDNSAAALTFGDPESAEQTLRSLGADEHIAAAFIYDLEGKPFAGYQPPGAVPLAPPPVQRNFHRVTDEYLEIFQDAFVGAYVEASRDIAVDGEVIRTA